VVPFRWLVGWRMARLERPKSFNERHSLSRRSPYRKISRVVWTDVA